MARSYKRSRIAIGMIFNDLIRELNDTVKNAVDELFDAARTNQSHPQDMLLVDQHGFYDKRMASVQECPYLIGPDVIGFGENTLYKFIDWYRKSHLCDKSTFEEQIENNEDMRIQEELIVQLEMGIYLRFWEAESLLKRYCQLTGLACGKTYDWHLEVPVHSRQGSKCDLIRKKIRDQIMLTSPLFYKLVKGNYISQVRNAIAHSQFYIIDRSISFLNHSEDPAAHTPCKGVSFDQWYRTFHTTLLLHNETIRAFSEYRKRYKLKTLKNGNRICIRITGQGRPDWYGDLGIRHDRDEWIWNNNLNDEDLAVGDNNLPDPK